MLLISIIVITIFLAYFNSGLPDHQQLAKYYPDTLTRLYTSDGKVLKEFADQRRIFIPIEGIPQTVRDAFIAIEDRNFYTHTGIDLKGILRALITNIIKGKRVQGGSTITQQVTKNILLSNEKTLSRKIKEAILSLRITLLFSKDRVLELYLNEIYLGAGSYGVADAALNYFNKSIDELNLEEAALLAALPKAPSTYNPWRNPEIAKKRRNLVLLAMARENLISRVSANKAMSKKIKLTKAENTITAESSYFADEVQKELTSKYGRDKLYKGGMVVHTTLDLKYQKMAEESFRQGLLKYAKRHGRKTGNPEVNGGMVVMNPHNGNILAMVGGYNFKQSNFNRTTQAKRQPGSVFKPFVYLSALEQGYSPANLIADEPIEFEFLTGIKDGIESFMTWAPQNHSNTFHGATTLRVGIEKSINVMTVHLGILLGIDAVIKTAERFGVYSNAERNLATLLGASETSLLSITTAYSMFVNGGKKIHPKLIDRIQDRKGKTIFKGDENLFKISKVSDDKPLPILPEILDIRNAVTDELSAFQMVSILEGVVKRGTGRQARKIGKPIAGKTGTTNKSFDSWFVGFSPDLVVGVYVGFDKPKSLGKREEGSTIALPIFVDFMKKALKGKPAKPFRIPSGIKMVKIDSKTGFLPSPSTSKKDIILEAFKIGNEPTAMAKRNSPLPVINKDRVDTNDSDKGKAPASNDTGGIY